MSRAVKLLFLFCLTVAAGLAGGFWLYPIGLDWLLPASMLTGIFLVLIARQWLRLSASKLVLGLQRSLHAQHVDYEGMIHAFGQVAASEARAAGHAFTIREHIRGLLLAQLSSHRPWRPIADNHEAIATVFFQYDPEKLITAES